MQEIIEDYVYLENENGEKLFAFKARKGTTKEEIYSLLGIKNERRIKEESV